MLGLECIGRVLQTEPQLVRIRWDQQGSMGIDKGSVGMDKVRYGLRQDWQNEPASVRGSFLAIRDERTSLRREFALAERVRDFALCRERI